MPRSIPYAVLDGVLGNILQGGVIDRAVAVRSGLDGGGKADGRYSRRLRSMCEPRVFGRNT